MEEVEREITRTGQPPVVNPDEINGKLDLLTNQLVVFRDLFEKQTHHTEVDTDGLLKAHALELDALKISIDGQKEDMARVIQQEAESATKMAFFIQTHESEMTALTSEKKATSDAIRSIVGQNDASINDIGDCKKQIAEFIKEKSTTINDIEAAMIGIARINAGSRLVELEAKLKKLNW